METAVDVLYQMAGVSRQSVLGICMEIFWIISLIFWLTGAMTAFIYFGLQSAHENCMAGTLFLIYFVLTLDLIYVLSPLLLKFYWHLQEYGWY